MNWVNWAIFALFALGAIVHFTYLGRSDYPRQPKPASPLDDAITLLMNLGLCAWVWNHYL